MSPLPAPGWFCSLLDRWRLCASGCTRRAAFTHRQRSRIRIMKTADQGVPHVKWQGERSASCGKKDRTCTSKAGSVLMCFTGQVVHTVPNRDRYWLNVLHLRSFRLYSGVGYRNRGIKLNQCGK
ncbi:MAG: hypothetical protein HS126_00010 [Anaerolineales bacterium]|nr:hypothetical protein [Anaerolineales bacterium]